MTWGGIGAAGVGAAASIFGSKKAKPKTVTAREYTQNTPFGNFSLGAGNKGLAGPTGFDTGLADLFQSYGKDSLTAAGNLPIATTPGEAPFDLMQMLGIGGPNAPGSTAESRQFSGAGQDALSQLGNFNPDDFAAMATGKLNNLALPKEQQAAQSLATRLFSRGRLGGEDSASGRAFGDLALSQSQAQDSRSLAGYTLADQISKRLSGQAGALSNTGANLAGANYDQLTGAFGTARDDQFNTANFANSLRSALGNQGTAANQNVGATMSQFLDLLDSARSGQNSDTNARIGATNTMNSYRTGQGNMIGQIGAGVANQIKNVDFTKLFQSKPATGGAGDIGWGF